MLVALSRSLAIFRTLSNVLACKNYLENDYEMLEQLPLPSPLPFRAAIDKTQSILCVLLQRQTTSNSSSRADSRHLEQDLCLLCGLIYALPVELRCMLTIDFALASTHRSSYNKSALHFSLLPENSAETLPYYNMVHCIYPDTENRHMNESAVPPVYTDLVLPRLSSTSIVDNSLHYLASMAQRYWDSHCIQLIAVNAGNNFTTSLSQPEQLEEIIRSLLALPTKVRIPPFLLQLLFQTKHAFRFSKTQMYKIFGVIHGHAENHGHAEQILKRFLKEKNAKEITVMNRQRQFKLLHSALVNALE